MGTYDPLASLASLPGLDDAAARATAAISRAHRRPAGLRAPEVISAESLLRGARLTAAWRSGSTGHVELQAGPETSAYSLLAPELLTTTVRSFARAPLGVLARIDVAAGGPGMPVEGQAARAQALATLISRGAGVEFDRLAPAVVHAEIAAHQVFGERSELVARVAARAMAIHTGLDPRGFAVPEVYLGRHRQAYAEALESYPDGNAVDALTLLMNAWEAGGVEADGIAQQARR